jgi:flagellin
MKGGTALRIGTNIPALRTSLTLKATDRLVGRAMLRLSTGRRINSAKDDAAGLAIANKLGMQVTGLNRASQNSLDGISLIQTTDGALDVASNILQRIRELSVQAANGVLGADDMSKIQLEIDQLVEELNDNAFKTEFNKIKTLNGESSVVAGIPVPDPPAGEDIASVMFVSRNTPPGVLKLNVARAGTPPLALIDIASLAGADSVVSINGASAEIAAGDPPEAARAKLAALANATGLDVKYAKTAGGYDYSTAYLAGRKAGKDQSFTVSATVGGAAQPLVYAPGTDAQIEAGSAEFEDPQENALPSFNEGMGIVANGNEITVTSRSQQEIVFRLKTMFNPVSGETEVFAYDDKTGSLSVGAPLDFKIKVNDYGPIMLQIGPNHNEDLPIFIPKTNSESLGLAEYASGELRILLNLTTQEGATESIQAVDKALSRVLDTRSQLGAYQNRLEMTITNLDTSAQNTEIARSRLQDTNMAEAMTEFTQLSVKHQAGIAILAQANQRPQQVLSLLQ